MARSPIVLEGDREELSGGRLVRDRGDRGGLGIDVPPADPGQTHDERARLATDRDADAFSCRRDAHGGGGQRPARDVDRTGGVPGTHEPGLPRAWDRAVQDAVVGGGRTGQGRPGARIDVALALLHVGDELRAGEGHDVGRVLGVTSVEERDSAVEHEAHEQEQRDRAARHDHKDLAPLAGAVSTRCVHRGSFRHLVRNPVRGHEATVTQLALPWTVGFRAWAMNGVSRVKLVEIWTRTRSPAYQVDPHVSAWTPSAGGRPLFGTL